MGISREFRKAHVSHLKVLCPALEVPTLNLGLNLFSREKIIHYYPLCSDWKSALEWNIVLGLTDFKNSSCLLRQEPDLPSPRHDIQDNYATKKLRDTWQHFVWGLSVDPRLEEIFKMQLYPPLVTSLHNFELTATMPFGGAGVSRSAAMFVLELTTRALLFRSSKYLLEKSGIELPNFGSPVERSPRTSVRRLSHELYIPLTSVWRSHRLTLRKKAYHIQVTHHLEEEDYAGRVAMCAGFLEAVENENLLDNLLCADEATFHACGLVNRHNCRIWADNNPRSYTPKVDVRLGRTKNLAMSHFAERVLSLTFDVTESPLCCPNSEERPREGERKTILFRQFLSSYSSILVTAVAERLARSPPHPGHRILACGHRTGRCRLLAGFLGDLPFPPALSFRRCSILTSITLIVYQDFPRHGELCRPHILIYGFRRGISDPEGVVLHNHTHSLQARHRNDIQPSLTRHLATIQRRLTAIHRATSGIRQRAGIICRLSFTGSIPAQSSGDHIVSGTVALCLRLLPTTAGRPVLPVPQTGSFTLHCIDARSPQTSLLLLTLVTTRHSAGSSFSLSSHICRQVAHSSDLSALKTLITVSTEVHRGLSSLDGPIWKVTSTSSLAERGRDNEPELSFADNCRISIL
ncbi:hypothetical protein PR048_002638 [Dryococelus australis]|uniref:Uncharacterized protein n=1 Tax=Dryococelus australis TaxID=614101 RepID=A0ABQ9ILH1_9NEOP|nr:hypothetical protein PR048_002638 [Dryococelus australis]